MGSIPNVGALLATALTFLFLTSALAQDTPTEEPGEEALDVQCCSQPIPQLEVCEDPQPVKKGGSMTIGLAFWPDGSFSDWGSLGSGAHPCDASNRTALAAANVGISYFKVTVDELTLLVTGDQLQAPLFSRSESSEPYQVSMVAFRGKYRTPPRLLSVADGTDVQIVESLTLVARFDKGAITKLEWFDLGCMECFSSSRIACLRKEEQESCAFRGNQCSEVGKCLTSVHMAFEGNDKDGKVFRTNHQLENVQKASVEDIYNSGRDLFSKASDGAKDATDKISDAAGG